MGIKIDLQECCFKCRYSRLKMDEVMLCELYGGATKEVRVSCENIHVCKFLESKQEQKNDKE